MQEIVAEDAPIVREIVPRQEAIDVYLSRGETDKARLLAQRDRDTLILYTAARTAGLLPGLHGAVRGLPGALRAARRCRRDSCCSFPIRTGPPRSRAITPYPKLFAVFEQAGDWLDRLGIRSAGALNDAIAGDRLRGDLARGRGAARGGHRADREPRRRAAAGAIRVVFVAGPSSSGKTTFAKRLAVQLLANGIRPMPLGLDDYFVDRDQTPRDANGEYDYETIRALDLGLFNEQLRSLIEGRPTELPHYNFVTGQREQGQTVTLGPDHVIIVEGIHGLNPALVQGLPAEWIFRVYVSALTQLNLDRHNRVSTTDCRLIRRMVRDAATRGYSAPATLHRWESVVRGEKQHIFRFQENADAIFNSALVHELAVLRPFAEPLLLQVRPEAPEFVESNRLLSFLHVVPAGAAGSRARTTRSCASSSADRSCPASGSGRTPRHEKGVRHHFSSTGRP